MNTLNQARIFISYSHRGNGLAWKGRLLTQLGQLAEARSAAERSVQAAKEFKQRTWEGSNLVLLGSVCLRIGDEFSANSFFKQAQTLFDDEQECLRRIAEPFSEMCLRQPNHFRVDPENASSFCEKLRSFCQFTHSPKDKALGLFAMGRMVQVANDFCESKEPKEDPMPYYGRAINGLISAGRIDLLPAAFQERGSLRKRRGDTAGALADFEEAWEIAERGPMRLHLADIHLHRARLFFREKPYPWQSPQADLAAAEKLINDCGYHRRDQELADAKLAILGHT